MVSSMFGGIWVCIMLCRLSMVMNFYLHLEEADIIMLPSNVVMLISINIMCLGLLVYLFVLVYRCMCL